MAQAAVRQFLLAVAAGSLLTGCVAGGGGEGTASGQTVVAPGTRAIAARGSARDVEAPEAFQVTDSALWDGRPSLGGIWVASPDAVDPERVVMVNTATGASVTGALFRRERENPGPPLQISSDAAEALGILAGQPTELKVTALRRPEAEPTPEPAPETAPAEVATAAAEVVPEAEASAEAAPEAVDAGDTGAAALAAAALAATGTATEGAEATADAAAEGADAAAEAPRKTWKERRAEAKARREAERAAKAAAKAEAEAQAAAAEAGADAGAVDPAASAVADVETAPLDARSGDIAAAPLPAPAAAPETAAPVAAEAPAAATGSASRPIQIASFSKEENANRAVEALAKIGIAASAQRSERNGTAVWGVVATGDAALLAQIKDAGFADAYFLP